MDDSESLTALVSGFYGPGAFACWICQYISLLIAPKRGPRGKLTLDLIAFLAYPIVAVVDALVKLAWLYAATKSTNPDDIDTKAIQLAIAFKTPVCICIHALTILYFTQSRLWDDLSRDRAAVLSPAVLSMMILMFLLVKHHPPGPFTIISSTLSTATIVLLHLGYRETFRTIFRLYLPGGDSTVRALVYFFFAPLVARLIMECISILSGFALVRGGTMTALALADKEAPIYMPAFNNGITELDQVFPLLIGSVTVAWSAVALLRDRRFLQRRTQDSVSSSETNPQTPSHLVAIRPQRYAPRRRQKQRR
ncbi:hypothetical protein IMZ48_46740 [Candidatus Bathyarchaeota archaeon]|nr:hypothetical protein [Candidatus Bathyarchaeota archaeon]